ncbi:3-oxoadipate enol-lactonase [Jiella marina]|uniref:3-oxoadipate enol-lactonase n=1 Tax=Jiella sp. LLJ827 TaxID=2917712 RepID=UPI00210108F0|nr:3-oxoadipate enol-lactonase [Jiella sp. LLJ827]MCQ0988967.1 3-oxoadipate enol-lactonase [Jiella sp. LLJ827]
MPFDRINGIVLHHRADGPADAPVIVLVNSLGSDFRIWEAVSVRLAERYRVIRYDKRGHGLSEVPPAPYGMEDHSADLAGVLDHYGVSKALLVGLSIGGPIALGVVAEAPDRVAGLVMMDTAPKIGTSEAWNERIAAIEEDGIAAIADGILARWFTPAYRNAGNPAFIGYSNMLLNSPVAGYLGSCAALRDSDLTEAARAVTVPTLCLVGDQDGSTPPDLVRQTAETIPGARFEIIEGAGHLPCIEQAEVTAGHIARFAEGIFGKASPA